MQRWMGGLMLLAVGLSARAGMRSFPGFMPSGLPGSEKPHPAIAALRDYRATLHTNLGDLAVEFEPTGAPNAVRNFVKLAQRGFYDGLRFYCVFQGRAVHAGDPTGKGTGDVGYALDYEESGIGHTAGTLALDRRPDVREGTRVVPSNSGSRFFINLTNRHHLDRDYTVFGRIAEGLEVARRIGAAATRPAGGRPSPIEEIVIERITIARKTEEAEPKPKSAEE